MLSIAYMEGIALQSDYARKFCVLVSAAASLGLITTEPAGGGFGRRWRPTSAGYMWVKEGADARLD